MNHSWIKDKEYHGWQKCKNCTMKRVKSRGKWEYWQVVKAPCPHWWPLEVKVGYPNGVDYPVLYGFIQACVAWFYSRR